MSYEMLVGFVGGIFSILFYQWLKRKANSLPSARGAFMPSQKQDQNTGEEI